MAAAENYELFDDQPTGFARWVLPALIISVLLHVIFYMWATGHTVSTFSDSYYDRIVPRTFQVDRVEIDPAVFENEAKLEETTQAARSPATVEIPEEKVSFQEIMGEVKASPAAPPIENPLLSERPSVSPTTLADTVQTAVQSGAQSVVEDMNALKEELIIEDPVITGRPLLDLGKPGELSGSQAETDGISAGSDRPGFSNLDNLLAQTGPLTDATAPILMPADLLFDYDSHQLQEVAISSLRKLGELIQRNPQANFLIEGHSDSFGGADYNLELSRTRALTVKSWLAAIMGIDPARIQTTGFGSSRLIAPATGTIEEQQINRRVEIVIRNPAASQR
jgi:outer membrane protein OmpA-like peptidoglycan-associated protein